MAINYRKESSQLLYDFLMYHKNIQNHSAKTVQEYFLDLRTFFRYLIWLETDEALEFDEISIKNCNLEFAQKIRRSDIYDYLSWLSEERNGGLEASSRARKLASIHSFFHGAAGKESGRRCHSPTTSEIAPQISFGD